MFKYFRILVMVTMVEYDETRRAFLMRHGDYESLTGKLNEVGYEQVNIAGDKICQYLVDSGETGLIKVFSSPSIRTQESAELLVDRLIIEDKLYVNPEPEIISQLTENYDYGEVGWPGHKLLERNYEVGILVSHQPVIFDMAGKFFRLGEIAKVNFDKSTLEMIR